MKNFKITTEGLTPLDAPDGDPPAEAEIEICVEWLRKYAIPRISANRRYTSYLIKHVIEIWSGRYISPGAIIAAALRCEIGIMPVGSWSPSVYLAADIDEDALAEAV